MELKDQLIRELKYLKIIALYHRLVVQIPSSQGLGVGCHHHGPQSMLADQLVEK